MSTDPHDPRTFRRYVQLNPDGSVASVHDFEASVENPLPGAVEVTNLAPSTIDGLSVDPALVQTLAAAAADIDAKQAVIDAAVVAHADAQTTLTNAQAAIRGALSVSAAKAVPLGTPVLTAESIA